MNIVYWPTIAAYAILSWNRNAGKVPLFFNFSGPNPSVLDILMFVIGALSSILTYSGIFGFLMLILSPVYIIYTMITVIPHMSYKGL